MTNSAKNCKRCEKTESKRKLVTIDITEYYDQIRERAKSDIRTVDEEIRFLLRSGLNNCNGYVNYVYSTTDTDGITPSKPIGSDPWTYTYGTKPHSSTCVSTGSGCDCDTIRTYNGTSANGRMQPINEVIETELDEHGCYVQKL